MAESPLLPLVGVTIGLLGLIGILVFAVLKLRGAGREKRAAGADRLSEEAFAAATIRRRSARGRRLRARRPPRLVCRGLTASTARCWKDCRPASSSPTRPASSAAARRSRANGSTFRRQAPGIRTAPCSRAGRRSAKGWRAPMPATRRRLSSSRSDWGLARLRA